MDLLSESPTSKLIESRIPSFDNVNKFRENARKPPFIFHLESSLPKLSYTEFFDRHLMPNKPCLFPNIYTDGWRSRAEWAHDSGKPNFQLLKKYFGQGTVPVANCNQECYSSHPKQDLKFADFIKYWEDYIASGYDGTKECLYLKDWHFNRDFPLYKAYTTLEYFTSDWLNEFWDTRVNDHDDYRFVYMGPKGSWTPFHADVFRSYSWSANIVGRKKWILFPPGEEECLKDKYGSLVYDVTSDELNDRNLYPRYRQLQHRIEIIQEAGEIIFVPSGWHHQVHNLEDTISINHNWLNGCNVDICWSYIKQCLMEVQNEISDCKDMEGWHQQCQLILKASSGIDYTEFFTFMKVIANKRIEKLEKRRRNNENSHNTEISDKAYSSKVDNVDSKLERPDISKVEHWKIDDDKLDRSDSSKVENSEIDGSKLKPVTDTHTIHSDNTTNLGICKLPQDSSNLDMSSSSSTECTDGKNTDTKELGICKPPQDSAKQAMLKSSSTECTCDKNVDTVQDSLKKTCIPNSHECSSVCGNSCVAKYKVETQNKRCFEANELDPGERNTVEQLDYVLFDLGRVKYIIEDMLKTQEFLEIDSLQSETENLLSLIKNYV